MARYRKKPEVVEVEVYKPGMEDGFLVKGDYGLEVMPKEEVGKVDWQGYEVVKPVISTLDGYH